MRIALTTFAMRQWQSGASGTYIDGLTPEELVTLANQAIATGTALQPGYAPFCTHLFLRNPSATRCGFAPITEENHILLRSGYRSRRDGELAVLERWFEDLEAPTAQYLDVILYSHEQLQKEAREYPDEDKVPDCDWGIVSIIGTLSPSEPPMPPITQMRNALGTSQGGSGVPVDPDAYARAVAFWNCHASVRKG
ncbi:MAG: DUF3228 family protein [Hyphomicrobiaceae bacterium]